MSEKHEGAVRLLMNEKHTTALRLLEDAADRGARKGLKANDMVIAMLDIVVTTHVGFGHPIEGLVAEVRKLAELRLSELEAGMTGEVGPPLGTL